MHVALVTHHYPPEVGAPQHRWAAFVERFVAAGHRVSVLTPPPHYPGGRAGDLEASLRPGAIAVGAYGETVYRVRFREHGPDLLSRSVDQAISAGSSLRRGLHHFATRNNRPDVVIATAPGIPSLPAGMALGLLLRRPTVVEMRDAWPDLIAPSGMMGPDDRTGVRRHATRLAHNVLTDLQRHATAVVTTTVGFADVLRDRGLRRIEVIRNGAHVPDIDALEAPPLTRAELHVLYLGTLGRSQGLDVAITAAEMARERGTAITLRIAGSGIDEGYLRTRAEQLRAPVEFVGRIDPADVPDQYRWADTGLVALRDWEPFAWTVPSKLYEILAANRHVSAAIAGEAAFVVREADAGDTVPPQEPVALAELWERLAQNRDLLDVAGRGRQWVAKNAEFDSLAAHYLDLLEDVAG